ncbi:FG-GAP repeat protein [Candidatus Nitrososphaera evergladensis SR1]|uniref:FG-GAP repeat protein n=1 Tax=Candidatus Nitrososphaera evergladensis SR1 TaxID=1459636 RepID=A0A075MU22_9ARCH|nr:FG-GAP-like repeat-containing protein [Candidatus Nitrososphaera evergladensis]AIF82779.1 FG-GAP repeat protein [Candidatus Nitrososphaera evergladensis SR1]
MMPYWLKNATERIQDQATNGSMGKIRWTSFFMASILVFSIALVTLHKVQADSIIDFNGDGYADMAIGVPNESISGIRGGEVNVIYGSSSGLDAAAAQADQVWNQDLGTIADSVEAGDNYGWSLAVGDFNGDGYSDLAIGIPDEDVGNATDAGAVNVIYGSASGLSDTSPIANQFWTQDSTSIADTAESGDAFGFSLAGGDFNGDGYSDLAIGVRTEDVGAVNNAGAVNVIYGSASGLSTSARVANQFWSQGSGSIADSAEDGDVFGEAVTTGDFNGDGYSDLAIGVPSEDIGAVSNGGAVNVIYGSEDGLSATSPVSNQFWNQDSTSIADTAETQDSFGTSVTAGDFNGDGYNDLAVSASGEGAVNVIYGSSSGLSATTPIANQFWHHDSGGILGIGSEGSLGAPSTTGDFNGDGYSDLALAAQGEFINFLTSSGAVNILYGSPTGLGVLHNQFWSQNSPGIEETSESGDVFGSGIAAGDFNGDGYNDLAIGIQFEDFGTVTNAGAVEVIYGSPLGLSATIKADQFWTQDSTNVEDVSETDDHFGFSLASGSTGPGL